MPSILYDIRTAPLDIGILASDAYAFVMFGIAIVTVYWKGSRGRIPTIFYSFFMLTVAASLAWVIGYSFERRANCINVLNNRQYEVVEGTLQSFKHILIPKLA